MEMVLSLPTARPQVKCSTLTRLVMFSSTNMWCWRDLHFKTGQGEALEQLSLSLTQIHPLLQPRAITTFQCDSTHHKREYCCHSKHSSPSSLFICAFCSDHFRKNIAINQEWHLLHITFPGIQCYNFSSLRMNEMQHNLLSFSANVESITILGHFLSINICRGRTWVRIYKVIFLTRVVL